jgi:hypothetical protein
MGKRMQYFEKGLYSIAEASKLTRIDSRSVSRWLQGYHYKRSGKLRESPPVIVPDYEPVQGKPALSWQDNPSADCSRGQDRDLLDLVKEQYAIEDILSPLLLDGIDFDGELPT